MQIKSFLAKIKIPHSYYYVSPCPNCGSKVTGRLVRRPLTDADKVMELSLKNGELIKFSRSANTAYCETCNHEWYESIKLKLLPREEIENQKKIRNTEEKLAGLNSPTNKTKYKIEDLRSEEVETIKILYLDEETIKEAKKNGKL